MSSEQSPAPQKEKIAAKERKVPRRKKALASVLAGLALAGGGLFGVKQITSGGEHQLPDGNQTTTEWVEGEIDTKLELNEKKYEAEIIKSFETAFEKGDYEGMVKLPGFAIHIGSTEDGKMEVIRDPIVYTIDGISNVMFTRNEGKGAVNTEIMPFSEDMGVTSKLVDSEGQLFKLSLVAKGASNPDYQIGHVEIYDEPQDLFKSIREAGEKYQDQDISFVNIGEAVSFERGDFN